MVICPKIPAPGNPWLWRGSFWGATVNRATELTVLADLKLADRGFHVVIAGPAIPLGHPDGNQRMDLIYKELTEKHGLARKPALMGLSREGLSVYRWASANPEKVACIYIDNGVCDFKSWPGGKLVADNASKGDGDAKQWQLTLQTYGFKSDAEALAYRGNPIDILEPLAKAKVPLLHVCGAVDTTVPYAENSEIVKTRYEQMGGKIQVILKPSLGHHPHGMEDPTPILDFIQQHAGIQAPEGTQPAAFWIAPSGNDANPGTREQPFATLEAARDAVRTLRNIHGLPPGGVVVNLRGGVYLRDKTFNLTAEDSGTTEAPIVYRSAPGERAVLNGGIALPSKLFKPVSDPAILKRFPEEAADRVVQADLKAYQILGLGEVQPHADYRIVPLRTAAPEPFFNGMGMRLAQWPNYDPIKGQDCYTTSAEVKAIRQPARRWAQAKAIWLMSQKAFSRESYPIELAKIGEEGIKKTEWIGGCLYYNILEELDQPGEYFVDRGTGILYIYPPARIKDGVVEISVLSTPMVILEKTKNIELRGLTLSTARDHGVVISAGAHNRVVGCEIRNLGKVGVVIGVEDPFTIFGDTWPTGRLWPQFAIPQSLLPLKAWEGNHGEGGNDNGVIGCDIHGTGAGGIAIAGGDRPSLTSAKNFALNNHIWNYHRIKGSYGPAVNVGGVGQRISHNLIHGAAHNAIEFNGNEHLMEFNEIFDVLNDTTDAGAIYSGRELTFRGNRFVHNFMHDIIGRGRFYTGIYLDDLLSSLEIRGNVFAELYDGGISVNGGRDNKIVNNIFFKVSRAINMHDYRSTPSRWGMLGLLKSQPFYQNPIWSERYPELARVMEDEPGAAKGNIVERNLFCDVPSIRVPVQPYITFQNNLCMGADGVLAKLREQVEKDRLGPANLTLAAGDPGFVDPARGDFRLHKNSPVWERIPGFEAIPLGEIGLCQNEVRPNLNLPPFRLLAPMGEEGISPERLIFSWAPCDGATRYRVLVARDPAFNDLVVDITTRSTWLLSDALDFKATYFWKVEAQTLARQLAKVDNTGGPAQFTTMAMLAPQPPTGLQGKARFQKVDLCWNRVPGRCSYSIYRREGAKGEFSFVAGNVGGLSYTDKVPVSSRTWNYVLKATNAEGESKFSESIGVNVGDEHPALVALNLDLDREQLRPGDQAAPKLSGLMSDGDPASAEELAAVSYEISAPEILSVDKSGKLKAVAQLPETAAVKIRARLGAVSAPERTITVFAIPEPWNVRAYGSQIASVSHRDGEFTLRSNGKNVWDKADDFLFVFQWLGADTAGREVTLQSTLLSTETPITVAAAGLMFREAPHDPGARNVLLRVEADGRLLLTYRLAPGGESQATECGKIELPATLRLVRRGNLFTASKLDGDQWRDVGEVKLEIKGATYAGMAAFSSADGPMKAVFKQPTVSMETQKTGAAK